MPTITAVSFFYNEEVTGEQSLAALRPFVDEIIVIDLESTDRTFEICKKYADKVIQKPWAICGDRWKMLLREEATSEWLLWFYGDEIFPEKTAKAMKTVAGTDEYTAFAFMRHEIMDGIRLMPHGTIDSPNYQNRLHRKCPEIFYTELVHAEIHGKYHACSMPPDYYIEHHKTSKDQEFDNIRLYIYYKYLIWLYGDTQIEPYREMVSSYRQIVHDSEVNIEKGIRRKHPAEEEWWRWRDFQQIVTSPEGDIVDRAIREMNDGKV